MSTKFICNICNEEIKLYADSVSDIMTVVVTGKQWVRIGSKNEFRDTKSILHIHYHKCYKKFLSVFEKS